LNIDFSLILCSNLGFSLGLILGCLGLNLGFSISLNLGLNLGCLGLNLEFRFELRKSNINLGLN
jgi:hypothetical protein